MRAMTFNAITLLAAVAVPAQAQVSARLHVDIPIGRRPVASYPVQRGPISIREYDARQFGDWDNYYDDWAPETVYLYNGYYYDYPVVAYAQPVIVYRYRNQMFFAPRQREFVQWRERRDYGYRNNYRPAPRDDHRQYEPQRGGYDGRYGRNEPQRPQGNPRDDHQTHSDPRGNSSGHSAQPSPRGGNDGHGGQGAQRGGDRGRPGGH